MDVPCAIARASWVLWLRRSSSGHGTGWHAMARFHRASVSPRSRFSARGPGWPARPRRARKCGKWLLVRMETGQIGPVAAWFKTGVGRVTDSTDRRRHLTETGCHERVAQSGSQWLILGRSLGHLARSGGDPERGFSETGRAEVVRAQTMHIPSLASVDSGCLQAISGPGSRPRTASLTAAQRVSNVRARAGEGVRLSLSRRNLNLRQTFRSDHLAPTGRGRPTAG